MAILIYDVNDLQDMNLDLAGDYELGNDIDASATATWNPTTDRGEWQASTYYAVNDYVLVSTYSPARTYLCKTAHTSGETFATTNWTRIDSAIPIPEYLGFRPIGCGSSTYFTGAFDGKDYAISNLYVWSPEEAGLFGGSTGTTMQNIRLTSPNITGVGRSWIAGGIFGWIATSIITNCHVIGGSVVNHYFWAYVGGVGGYISHCTTSKCSSSAFVQCSEGDAGGFAGDLFGSDRNVHITSQCFATGNVESIHEYGLVGGFVGCIDWGGGTRESVVEDCYAMGNVSSADPDNWWTGGFVSTIGGTGVTTFRRCFSTGSVDGDEEWENGFTGDSDGIFTDCFWDIETSGRATSAGGTGKTTGEMNDIATFSAWDIQTSTTELNNGYPFLSWQISGSSPVWYIYALVLNPIHTDVYIVALEALRNIEMSAMGRVYTDEEGNLCYENRYARQL